MGTIYVIGAGFSRTCGIATDFEMLDALNPLLGRVTTKGGTFPTFIEAVKEQSFQGRDTVGLEEFMSTVSALKFMPEFMELEPNIFAEGEKELRQVLKRYLRKGASKVDWRAEGQSILEFVAQANWDSDIVITFNYDLLLENAMKKMGVDAAGRILHLHGSLADRTLAYPTYKKLAYRNTRSALAKRWKEGFDRLRELDRTDRLVFIGYSMPPSDLEAKGLFNYSDWYNAYESNQRYAYPIIVVNRDAKTVSNYSFLRRPVKLCVETFASWVQSGAVTRPSTKVE